MELFKLLGVIAVNNAQALKDIDETTEKAKDSGDKMRGSFNRFAVFAVKAVSAAAAAGASAVGVLTKQAVASFAEYEQLKGGVETLFKDSADKLLDYANKAWYTAGMSANQYMEMATGFSASLLQSLGGDTKKAADMADMAMIDMSDNVNKMGTAVESVQYAYQGFAKQNFTMLDNLKLGYGGTKEEMVRLLADAEKIKAKNGEIVNYSIDSFADIVEAIHVVQGEIGITGTTMEEAEGTISGSIAMMKASWQNLITGVGAGAKNLDKLVEQFTFSVEKVGKNTIPVIERSIKGIGTLVTQLLPPLLSAIPKVLRNILPGLLQSTMDMLRAVFGALGKAIPTLGEVLTTDVLGMLTDMLAKVSDGLANQLPGVLEGIMTWLLSFTESLRENAGVFIDAGLHLIVQLAKGLTDALPMLIETVPTIVSNIAGLINDNAPKLLVTAARLIWMLVTGLIQAIPTIVVNIPKIIQAIVDVLLAFNWFKLGKSLITKIKDGFIGENPYVINAAKKVKDSIIDALKELPAKLFDIARNAVHKVVVILKNTVSIRDAASAIKNEIVYILGQLPAKMVSIGNDLLMGLWRGIGNAKNWVLDRIGEIGGSILKKIKKVFKIHSPSKETEADGAFLMEGLGKGITGKLGSVLDTVTDMGGKVLGTARKALADGIDTNISVGYDVTARTRFGTEMATETIDSATQTKSAEDKMERMFVMLEFYLAEILKKLDVDVQIDGDSLVKFVDKKLAEKQKLGLRGI